MYVASNRSHNRQPYTDALNDWLFSNVSTLLRMMSKPFLLHPVRLNVHSHAALYLRRLKPYLRPTLTKSRLSSLALLHVHRNITIDLDEAVDRYARQHPKK